MARIIDAFTQFFDNSGNPLVKGKLKFLESGTNNTDKPTFKDAALTPALANTNPVILDGAGRLAFSVFGSGIYNVILTDANDGQIQQFDPVGASATGSQFDEWDASEVYDSGDIVRGSDGGYYQSFINSNSNNNPTVSPTQWDLITIVKSYIADASGTADVITADFVPVIHSLVNNTRVTVTASAANSSTVPTFAPNGLTAKIIVKNGNQALSAGDIAGSGFQADMVYRSGIDKWELLNPSGDFISKPSSSVADNITIFDTGNEVKDSGIPISRVVQIADAAGLADVITAAFTPAITALTDGLEVRVKALLPNATATPTINIDSLGAKTIVKLGDQPLSTFDIAGPDHELKLVYNSTNDNFELLNPAVSEHVLARVNFNGVGTLAIRDSFNVLTVDDNGTGDYTVNYINSMPDVNYNAQLSGRLNSEVGALNFGIVVFSDASYTVSSIRVSTGASQTNTVSDSPTVLVTIIGS